jgi:hypothetical protein
MSQRATGAQARGEEGASADAGGASSDAGGASADAGGASAGADSATWGGQGAGMRQAAPLVAPCPGSCVHWRNQASQVIWFLAASAAGLA